MLRSQPKIHFGGVWMIGHLPKSPHTVYTQVMMHPKGPGNANVVNIMCGDIVYLKETLGKEYVFMKAQVHQPKTGGIIW